MSLLLPNLISLDLNGSVLNSLRELGYDLNNLTYLNISNCGLTSLDGTSGMTNVRKLVADGNLIRILGSIGYLSFLTEISLKDNKIQDLSTLTFLQFCPELLSINLQGNPVTKESLYRSTMERVAKKLEILDEKPIEKVQGMDFIDFDEKRSNSSNEQFSSLDSNSISQDQTSQNEVDSQKCNGIPIAGTVLELVRQTRRRGSSSLADTNSSSSSISDYF